MSIWEWLLNPAGLTAHGFCLSWAPGLVALHAGSDALIGLAYFSIPVAMAWFIRERRDSRHWPVAYLFAAFILACGTTHLFSILTLWVPVYGIEGLVKAITAALSIATALALWPLVPRLLALPTPELLVALNMELSRRVAAQEEAAARLRESEAGMRALNADLERRVAERTSALEVEIVARRDAEERFRQVIESAPTAMIMIDGEGAIELVNIQTERTFGYSREELLGRSVDILLPDRLRANHRRHRATFFASPTPRAMGIGQDLFGRRKDGSEFPVEIGLNPLTTPQGQKVISSISDITKRKEMEKALRDSEQQVGLMFDSVQGHAIFMLDAEGRIITWNSGAERLKGYAREDILGRHFSLFYPPEDVANGKPEGELVVATREGRIEDESWRQRKDGSRFMASVIINAVRDSRGDLRGFVKVTRDITDRKKIENELIETNERFALAADAAGLGFWDYDIETQAGQWDDRMYRIYGLAHGAAMDAASRRSRLHPDDRARAEGELLEAIAGGRPFDTEFRIVQPGGEVRHLRAAAAVKRGTTTGGTRVFGVNFDITERKEIENKLIEANERFALAAEAASLGFWDLDVDTRSVHWNDEMFRLRGLARAEGDYDPLRFEHLHADDRARIEGEILAAAAGERSFDADYRIVRPDGRVRHMKSAASLKRDPTGCGGRLIGVSFDVTERKEIENQLIEANERFAVAAEAASLAFWDLDIQTWTCHWDDQMFKLLGVDRIEGNDNPIEFKYVHADDRARVEEEMRGAAAGTRGFDSEYRIVRPDGRVRHTKAAASLRRDPTGRGGRLIGVSFDITERKESELSIEQARNTADAANRTKSAFLASMSHEIRTPMNGVIGFADLLLDSNLTEQQRNQMTRLQDAAKSLLSLMNDILDLSKIEAGKLEIETIPTSPETVVQGAVSVLRAQIAAKGLDLRVERSAGLPDWIESDPTRLRQILLNLLSNALKFTDSGRITIRSSREAVDDVEYLRFEVADTGIGIPADCQHLLFRDFSQVDSSTTRRYGGSGLGLSICKRLARAMGGEIGVRSVPGEGSTIWFTIRLRACGAPDLSVARDPRAVVANPARVLVADDLEMNRDIVEAMLRQAGHFVRGVDNGRRAVIAVQESDFDVVLMDMEMPEMDGVEATRAIRRLDERIRHIPIVALTANAFLDDRQRCHEAGMNDFLPKPIGRDELLAMVAKWSGGIPRKKAGMAHALPLVLDVAVLDAFDSALGAEEAARFSGKFRKQVRDAVAALTSAEEPAFIAREAHKLVNLAGNLGCVELVGFARNLCSEAKRENGDVDGVLIDLPATVDRAVAALAARYPG